MPHIVLTLFLALVMLLSITHAQAPLLFVPNMKLGVLTGLTNWWRGVPGRTGGATWYNLVPGSLNHGTLTNMSLSSTSGWSPSSRPGNVGGWQINADGIDDRLDTAENAGMTSTSSFSLCAWVICTAANVSSLDMPLITQAQSVGTYQGIMLWFGQFNAFPVFDIINTGGTTELKITSNTSLALSTWHHICATYDGSQNANGEALYANGAQLSTSITVNTSGAFPDRPWRFLTDHGVTPSSFWPGAVESVMVFTRTLRLGDVQTLYQVGLQGDLPLFVRPFEMLAAPAGTPGSFLPFMR